MFKPLAQRPITAITWKAKGELMVFGKSPEPPAPFPPNFYGTTTIESWPTPGDVLRTGGQCYINYSVSGYPPPTVTFQWYSGPSNTGPWTPIAGETDITYLMEAATESMWLRCVATATNSEGSDTTEAVGFQDVALPNIPELTVAPVISGGAQVGSELTTDNGTWANGVDSYSYRWLRNGAYISGATASTYTTVAQDVGNNIRSEVTATNAAGSNKAASSNFITPVAAPSVVSRADELLELEADGLAIAFADSYAAWEATGSMMVKTAGVGSTVDPLTLLTRTSASTKWVLGKNGLMTEVAANLLPIEYDGAGNSLGVLNEPEATNLFLNSGAPVTQTITLAAGDVTVSVHGGWTVTPAGQSPATEGNPVTFTAIDGALEFTVTGSAGSDLNCVQVEAGSEATSPIITAGVPVTRAEDRYTYNFAPSWNGAGEETWYAALHNFARTGLADGQTTRYALSQNTYRAFYMTSDNMRAYQNSTTILMRSTGAVGADGKYAFAMETGVQYSAGYDGVLNETDQPHAGNGFLGQPSWVIGAYSSGGVWYGHIKEIMVLPRRMTNAELQGLTA